MKKMEITDFKVRDMQDLHKILRWKEKKKVIYWS